MTITIRPAILDDVDTLVAGNVAMALEAEHKRLDPATVREGVRAVFLDPALGRYFVAEVESRVVGQAMITFEWSDWRNGQFWWLQSVYVAPVARRLGVFSAIYRHLEAQARKDPGCCGLRLYVERENERAQQTYARCGMQDAGYFVMEVDMSGAVKSAQGE